jgi:hypothetical protein
MCLGWSVVGPKDCLIRVRNRSKFRRDGPEARRLKMTDSVEKLPGALGVAHHSSICETIFSPSRTFLTAGTGGFVCGVQPLIQVGRHSPSCNAAGRLVQPWPPDMFCQRLQVLHDGGEVKLIAGAGEAPQAHALEAMVGLEVCKPHLDFLALVA